MVFICVAFDVMVFSSSCVTLSDHKDHNDTHLHTLGSLDFRSSVKGLDLQHFLDGIFDFIGVKTEQLHLVTSSRSTCAQSETLVIYSGYNE